MSAASQKLLVLDPDETVLEFLANTLIDEETRLVWGGDPEFASQKLETLEFDAIWIDLSFDGGKGFQWISQWAKKYPHTPIIASAAKPDSRSAIEAVKAGSFDFLSKPLDQAEVRKSLQEAFESSRRAAEPVAIDPENELQEANDSLVGNSREMLNVYKQLGRLSPTPVTVLIRGETGTGKELIARALYQYGHRSHKPLITVNCAAIPENLLESELFGHEKGAFTGATSTRLGKFEQANNATLFLDEIGDLDMSLQAKLLRVLQEKRFQRVGGSEEISADVRIIAATHQPIEEMIEDGRFREDLFYRLNVASIDLPPLRDRKGDVPVLVSFFLRRFSTELEIPSVPMTQGALELLEAHPLPGNVRQLQNLVRKSLLKSRGYPIDLDLIRSLLDDGSQGSRKEKDQTLRSWCHEWVSRAESGEETRIHEQMIEEFERILVREAYQRSEGNISKASQWLGLSRLTFRERLKRFGITES
ncbi:MAG: sigma-54 dependent transcriptional regulator [Verrucomicrobiota bacterium]